MDATPIVKAAIASAGLAMIATFAGAGLAAADTNSSTAPVTTLTVQDGGTRVGAAVDGASIDGDGTQGVMNGPLEMARPQIKAAPSTPDRP